MRKILLLTIISCLTFAQFKVPVNSNRDSIHSQNNLAELRSDLDDIFSDPNFANAFWGVTIQSLKTGETIYRLNSDKLFVPASLLKLFTTSTALLLLGPDYKFKTSFYTDGEISEGILYGNLIIVGNGDPTVSTGQIRYDRDHFVEWIDSLNDLGIYSIKGNVIANDYHFTEDRYGKGWFHEYENNWLIPYSGSFCLNGNTNEIIIEPSEIGRFAHISNLQNNINYEIVNNIITNSKSKTTEISITKVTSNIIKLNGQISKTDKAYSIQLPVEDPTQFFINTLYEVWLEEGITITGHPLKISELSHNIELNDLFLLFENKSDNLSQIVAETNMNSNNLYAEQVLKTIGYELIGYGSTINGITTMKELLQKMGINTNNFKIVDGSGLSTLNLITPKQIINLLSYMYKSDAFADFYKSLSIAGFNGSLLERMKKTKAENNFRGKSGYLENTRALAGYIKTGDGEPVAVALIVNNFLVPSQLANYVQDKVCNRLANFTRK